MAKGKGIHVVPSGDKWAVKEAGKDTPLSEHRTQQRAIERGVPAARANESELNIHGRNGQIREKNSYGNDPKTRKG